MKWRSNDTIINEAELLSSPAHRVADWLKSRAETATLLSKVGDEDLEHALLSKSDPLIDISLAQYAFFDSTLRELFTRQRADGSTALRLAVLSNAAAANHSFWFPSNIIGARDDCASLGRLSPAEIAALFSNPELPDMFIRDFLEEKEGWQALDDDRRRIAVASLFKKLVDRAEYDGHWDGFAEYSHNAVFDRVWQLGSLVPVTPQWANILGPILEELRPQAFSIKAPLKIGERWRPDPSEAVNDNKRGYLHPMQSVRMGLARLALHKAPGRGEKLLEHKDVAVRCAAYSLVDMSAEEVRAAFDRDGKLGTSYMLRNYTGVWRNRDAREALSEACWDATQNEPGDLSIPERFQKTLDRLEQQHPQWFEEPVEYDPAPAEDASASKLQAVQEQLKRQQVLLYVLGVGMIYLALR